MTPCWRGPAVWPAVLFIALLTAGAWGARHRLHHVVGEQPALVPAAGLALLALAASFAVLLAADRRRQLLYARRRAATLEGFERLGDSFWSDPMRSWAWDVEAIIAGPLLRTGQGRKMARDWQEAHLPGGLGRYLLLMVAFSAIGWLIGAGLDAPLLAGALAALLPLGPKTWVGARASSHRNQFKEQLPLILDWVASGLAAGLSLPQSIAHAAREAPDPSALVWGLLAYRLRLGQAEEEVFRQLQSDQPVSAIALLVDGFSLQRRFGGDMIRMLEDTAGLLRERIELEREVRAVTAQARLSGAVVAALAPVSAALLFLSNPAYVEILLRTLWGQGMLVLALVLQLTGWALITRLIEIQY